MDTMLKNALGNQLQLLGNDTVRTLPNGIQYLKTSGGDEMEKMLATTIIMSKVTSSGGLQASTEVIIPLLLGHSLF
jgi:hypothetical protein